MVFDSIFSYMSFMVYIAIFSLVYIYVKRIISNNGFNILSMFILTFSIFYLFVPFVQSYFKLHRDNTSFFTILLNQMSDEEVFFNFLICAGCLLFIILSYNLRFKSKGNGRKSDFESTTTILDQHKLYKKINRITDVIFFISVISMVLLIVEVGSLKTYLTLGSLTRGLDKAPTDYIRPSYLQLVTFSTVVLVTPYLYVYLYRMRRSKIMVLKIIVSLIFSILFLLYNQGRAPLILFFLPFFFTFGKKRKKGFLGLTILFGVGVFLLSYLDRLFQYLAYGSYTVETNTHFITQFLAEFSYSFANFSLRDELVNYSSYRYMYDYLIWPFTMIPSSLLKIIGFSKESLIAVSTINTEAYGTFLGIKPSGGIPVDLLTFNYYQFGYITLIPICLILGRVLKKIDMIFYFFKDNFAIKIVLYRISFSMINILNNADISAIVRNRLDIVILFIIVIYIYKQNKNMKNKVRT